jgi:hypothetical protein
MHEKQMNLPHQDVHAKIATDYVEQTCFYDFKESCQFYSWHFYLQRSKRFLYWTRPGEPTELKSIQTPLCPSLVGLGSLW